MPLDIRDLQKRGVEVKIPMFGDELTVTYDPITINTRSFRDDWTKRGQKQIEDLRKKHKLKPTDVLPQAELELIHVGLMLELINGWDLEDGGKAYPLDAQRIADELPGLAIAVREAVWAHVNNLGNLTSSRNGSSPISSGLRRMAG